ncbi:hypothetical protein GLOTRDRAFT_125377 [Gloeophyllum trabeum ATCC 11539]|uniref:Uncharacterized protein n=1 Tax=Gloeophyllum trabeum (strain ATCC 11539 / FP-39264 / Madison 617) TaxID=670483 RepID=S7QII3_GLOTA|nr:uncharacterized protein GLOTRDRAFT_125377 [Gloeophyllum trabeum ATCC 11539]EPQ59063.1 hypothetical protein GLOTRDRAFT_125377 [Gloeophyllum trabeum ATCC 11539]
MTHSSADGDSPPPQTVVNVMASVYLNITGSTWLSHRPAVFKVLHKLSGPYGFANVLMFNMMALFEAPPQLQLPSFADSAPLGRDDP